MERQRKERLVGAAVLIMLAVIFIPMILDNSVQPESGIVGTNIPPQPEGGFASRVIPLTSTTGGGGEAGAGTEAGTTPANVSAAATVATAEKPQDTVTAPAASTPPPAPAAPVAPATPPVTTSSAPSSPVTAPAKEITAREIPARVEPAHPSAAGVTAWVVQLGSFSSAENAESLNKKLRQAGYSAFVEPLQQGGTKVFRVRVGPELRRSSAQTVRDRLQANMGLEGIVVPYP
jgi:DedD protein